LPCTPSIPPMQHYVPTSQTAFSCCGQEPAKTSLVRSQPFPRTSQNQSDSECRGEAQVYFTRLNLLQIPGRNLRPFRQLLLSQASPQAFAAHALAKRPYSRPLFLSERHPILNPRRPAPVNDTHIVKCAPNFPPFKVPRAEKRVSVRTGHALARTPLSPCWTIP
jgi:hypothetical protein